MSTLRRGDRFGDYEIVARLRSGGMATLYLGCRRGAAGFSRPVAIKIIHPHLARDATFVKMFIDEAKLSARIEDPHVVHVEDLGEANGALYLAMEYVSGCSLSQLLAALSKESRGLGEAAIAHLGAQIASGLQAAHELVDESGHSLGVVHRDVSPSNVLVARKGHVKLIDFGIAKVRSRAQHQTNTKALKGKLAYMSPEQARIEPVDRRTDIYALGVMLWELVTMKRCFDAPTDIRLLEMVRRPNVVPPSAHAEVAPALEKVIMAALEHDPERRPQTAADLRRMLLEAVPAAASVDRADMAALVERLLGKKLDEEQRLLPIDAHVYGGLSEPPPETQPAPSDLEVAPTEPGPISAPEAPEAPDERTQDRRWEALTHAATVMPSVWEETAPAPAPARPVLLTTVAAVAGTLAGIAIIGSLVWMRAREREPGPAVAATSVAVAPETAAVASSSPPASAVPPAPHDEPPPAEAGDGGAPIAKRTPAARGRGGAPLSPPPLATAARKPVQIINGVPINTDVGK